MQYYNQLVALCGKSAALSNVGAQNLNVQGQTLYVGATHECVADEYTEARIGCKSNRQLLYGSIVLFWQ